MQKYLSNIYCFCNKIKLFFFYYSVFLWEGEREREEEREKERERERERKKERKEGRKKEREREKNQQSWCRVKKESLSASRFSAFWGLLCAISESLQLFSCALLINPTS